MCREKKEMFFMQKKEGIGNDHRAVLVSQHSRQDIFFGSLVG